MGLSEEDGQFVLSFEQDFRAALEARQYGQALSLRVRSVRMLTPYQPRTPMITRREKVAFLKTWHKKIFDRRINQVFIDIINPQALEELVNCRVSLEFGYFNHKIHSTPECDYCDECSAELQYDLGEHYGNLCQYFELPGQKRNKARRHLPETLKSAVDVLQLVYEKLRGDNEMISEYYQEFEHYCLAAVYGITQRRAENLLNAAEWLLDAIKDEEEEEEEEEETEEGPLSDLTDQ